VGCRQAFLGGHVYPCIACRVCPWVLVSCAIVSHARGHRSKPLVPPSDLAAGDVAGGWSGPQAHDREFDAVRVGGAGVDAAAGFEGRNVGRAVGRVRSDGVESRGSRAGCPDGDEAPGDREAAGVETVEGTVPGRGVGRVPRSEPGEQACDDPCVARHHPPGRVRGFRSG